MAEASKKHKFCSICNARLDKIKRHNYSQVFKSDLVEKLRSLNPDYVCGKHAKQANSLILESSKSDSFNNPSINLLIVSIQILLTTKTIPFHQKMKSMN